MVTGIATPYVCPFCTYRVVLVVFDGFAIVVNVVLSVDVRPLSLAAVTWTVYDSLYFNGAFGIQLDPSGRISPSTRAPVESVTATSVTWPPATEIPISVLTGRSFASATGVIERLGGGACFTGLPPQPVTSNGAVATTATNTPARRGRFMIPTPFRMPARHILGAERVREPHVWRANCP